MEEIYGTKTILKFDEFKQIGEGAYGKVFQAIEKRRPDSIEPPVHVALKKIRVEKEKEGFPLTAIREIKILQSLSHPNIAVLREVVTSSHLDTIEDILKSSNLPKDKALQFKEELLQSNLQLPPRSVYLVFDYCDHDLYGLIESRRMRGEGPFPIPQVKFFLSQILKGLAYCHEKGILHRDIKTSNILVDRNGLLKLTDFGLARQTSSEKRAYTNRVITLWYRPPELLLGDVHYTSKIDLWSCGCIFAELLQDAPLFQGKDEAQQLELIFSKCGSPESEGWELGKKMLSTQKKESKYYRRTIREDFKNQSKEAIDLLDSFLMLDPEKRISAKDALEHEFFKKGPQMATQGGLESYSPSHQWAIKQKKKEMETARRLSQTYKNSLQRSQH